MKDHTPNNQQDVKPSEKSYPQDIVDEIYRRVLLQSPQNIDAR